MTEPCSSRCPAGSTRRWRPRCSCEEGHDVVGRHAEAVGRRDRHRAAARWPTSTTPARVARRLGIEHHVFNFGDDFDEHVVAPYVADHAAGRTPNPCIECNRHLKFDRLLAPGRRARASTPWPPATTPGSSHGADGTRRVARGADAAKDQSYVLHMLGQDALAPRAVPGRAPHQGRRAGRGGPARAAHRGQARQPGRVLHHRHRRAAPRSSATASPHAPAGSSTAPAPRSARSTPSSSSRSASATASACPAAPTPRYVVAVDVADGHRHRRRRRPTCCTDRVDARPTWRGSRRPRRGPVLVQCSAHGTPAAVPRRRRRPSCSTSPPAGSRPARAWCSTTATRSSAAASSPDPRARSADGDPARAPRSAGRRPGGWG